MIRKDVKLYCQHLIYTKTSGYTWNPRYKPLYRAEGNHQMITFGTCSRCKKTTAFRVAPSTPQTEEIKTARIREPLRWVRHLLIPFHKIPYAELLVNAYWMENASPHPQEKMVVTVLNKRSCFIVTFCYNVKQKNNPENMQLQMCVWRLSRQVILNVSIQHYIALKWYKKLLDTHPKLLCLLVSQGQARSHSPRWQYLL